MYASNNAINKVNSENLKKDSNYVSNKRVYSSIFYNILQYIATAQIYNIFHP